MATTTATAQRATSSRGNLVAIIAMFFLFAMISFVTNLAAPMGTIWKNNYEWSGMLGNMMNYRPRPLRISPMIRPSSRALTVQ